MSTLTHHAYNEYSSEGMGLWVSAGILALAVHAVFFTGLYISSNWHLKTPPSIVVEMWDSLPEPTPEAPPLPAPATEPPPPPPPAPKVEKAAEKKVVEPTPPKKADIEFKDKKKKTLTETKEEPSVAKPPAKPDDSAQKLAVENQRKLEAQKLAIENQKKLEAQQLLEKQRVEKEQAALKKEQAAREEERIQQRRDKMRAEVDAATASEKNHYVDLIRSKISSKIIMPPDVPDNAEAIFLVTLLPDGSVMDNVKLEKGSGNPAYDSAAERAIYKAQPLPMPQDATIARMFRQLRLSVKP